MVLKTKRLNLRDIAVTEINKRTGYRFDTMKCNQIYFNTPIDDISSISGIYGYSYKTFYTTNGKTAWTGTIKGSTLIKIIEAIKAGDIYGYIYNGSQRCKVRPKLINP